MGQRRNRILCIEDDFETAELIVEDLVDRGYEAVVAYDGHEGFSAILRERPDLVLCDISLPTMSGFEVLERLNAISPRLGAMPFVFLTALSDRENELHGRRLGADDYITKPIDFDMLGTIIETRLVRAGQRADWSNQIELNVREIETLTWAARGKTSAEIAQFLGLSKRTVDFHIDNARAKLGVATRIEAAIKATSGGIIKP